MIGFMVVLVASKIRKKLEWSNPDPRPIIDVDIQIFKVLPLSEF
jgi:hypothetical protein